MSMPNIPDVNANIDITIEQSLSLLLASIAFEELGLAHIINAEAEKIQYVLGTIDGQTPLETPPTIDDLLKIKQSVGQTMRSVIKNQMLLQFKLEDTKTISTTTTSTTTTTTTTTGEPPVEVGSAWSVGTSFGQGNAQYTTLASDEMEKTVVLGLGNNYIPVGDVIIAREGDNLSVTFTTVSPYIMNEVHLYVDNIAPTDSAPGNFPYQYTVINPEDYFTTHTFIVDVSAFAGETIYIAAHASILQEL